MRRTQALFLLAAILLVSPALVVAQGTEDPPTIMRTWGEPDVPYPGFGPDGIATDRWGNVYVTDRDEHCVWKFDANGAFLDKFGQLGAAPGEFSEPSAIDIDDNDFMYVLETGNLRVQKLDLQGNSILAWDTVTGAPGTFTFQDPRGLACTPTGEVYVTEAHYMGVFAFTSDGTPALNWGGEGSGPGYFQDPTGLDFSPSGFVYVADRMQHRIQVFNSYGVYQWEWADGEPDINLGEVTDLAIDEFGNAYVMDDDGQFLHKLAPDGSTMSVLGEFRDSHGVAIFGFGTVYGVDRQDREVHKCGYPPILTAIVDVDNDQGRWVRLTWAPTRFDISSMPTAVTGYGVYRRIDGKVMEDWDFIATVPARGDELYNLVAPTLCDYSDDSGDCWSVFAVTAFTSYGEFHDSAPDSGQSVDNLPPGAPAAPLVEEIPGALELLVSWDANPAPDLGHYAVYRGETPDFIPGDPGLPDFETSGLTFTDDSVSPGETWYYRIGVFDDAYNFSGYSPATGATVLTNAATPRRLTLLGAAPNPFNPQTTIAFYLPVAGEVGLDLHDLTGRVVRSLIPGTPFGPGRHDVSWDGLDDTGRDVASGVYVCRIKVGAETRTTRLVLVR
jgi:hypothetical protein